MLMQQIEKRLEIDWLVVGIITVVEWRKHLQLDSLIIYDILLMNKKEKFREDDILRIFLAIYRKMKGMYVYVY